MARCGLKKGMVSFIAETRYHCVTEEECEQLYIRGGQIYGEKMKLSLGDDLESFLTWIKNNDINFVLGLFKFRKTE